MVTLGNANSRMKDFYDVWMCSQHLELSEDTLLEAIQATFKNRETVAPPDEPEAFTSSFVQNHRAQWNAFVKKIGEEDLQDKFGTVVEDLRKFAMPLLRAQVAKQTR